MKNAMQKAMKRPFVRWSALAALLALVVAALLAGRAALAGTNPQPQPPQVRPFSFTFDLVPATPAIRACLPDAKGTVTVTKEQGNDKLSLYVAGLARNTNYDFFVLQTPGAPFGIAWYQSDLKTDANGEGAASMWGMFNEKTFSISPAQVTSKDRAGTGQTSPPSGRTSPAQVTSKDRAGTDQTGATFGPIPLYHLGLWFDDPQVPFKQGCEPGQKVPVVTPFNSQQHAGIQVLNTSNFIGQPGPLWNVPG